MYKNPTQSSVEDMINNKGSILIESLTKMIRREVEKELRQQLGENLQSCQSMVIWLISDAILIFLG